MPCLFLASGIEGVGLSFHLGCQAGVIGDYWFGLALESDGVREFFDEEELQREEVH